MLASDHNIDEDYARGVAGPSRGDPDDVVRDVDVSPLLRCLPRSCLQCCCPYQNDDDERDDGRSVRSDGEFSDLTQRLLASQRGGRDGALLGEESDPRRDDRARRRPVLVNKNVLLHYAIRFMRGAADSLWRGTVLSVFVMQLTPGSDGGYPEYFRVVGYLEGTFGLGRIIAAMLYADGDANGRAKANVRRSGPRREILRDEATRTPLPGRQDSFTLKCAGILLVVTAMSNLAIVAALPNHYGDYRLTYQLLVPVLLSYGYSSSVLLSSSAAKALLRRSSSRASYDQRSGLERTVALASGVLGPLVSIIVFAIVGNAYSIRNLQAVWYVGCCLEAAAGLTSLGYSERYQIEPEVGEDDVSESWLASEGPSYESPDAGLVEDGDDQGEEGIDESMRELQRKIDKVLVAEEGALRSDRDGTTATESPQHMQPSGALEGGAVATSPRNDEHLPSSTTDGIRADPSSTRSRISSITTLIPPALIVTSVLLFSAGGALFYPYYPIFFVNFPHLPPIQLQALYAAIPFILLISEGASRRFSGPERAVHRVILSMAAKSLAATFVILIGNGGYRNMSGIGLAVLFVLRMVFVDSAGKVETVLAAYVSSGVEESPTWKNGMDVARLVVWSACAAVGGVAIESRSMSAVLHMSGVLEFFGVAFMIMIDYWHQCRQ